VFCSAILFRYFNHFSRFIFAKKSCGAFIFIVGNQTQQKSKFILQKTSNYDYLKTCKQTDLENKILNWYSSLQCFVFCRFSWNSRLTWPFIWMLAERKRAISSGISLDKSWNSRLTWPFIAGSCEKAHRFAVFSSKT